MAIERGWWKIEFTVEPNELDLETIAELVAEGYTEGEIFPDGVIGTTAETQETLK